MRPEGGVAGAHQPPKQGKVAFFQGRGSCQGPFVLGDDMAGSLEEVLREAISLACKGDISDLQQENMPS